MALWSVMTGGSGQTDRVVPLRRRPIDIIFIVFFAVNLGFVTYIVDLESLTVSDPHHFTYPVWPPPPLVDLVHWWGRTVDPLLMARPAFWRMTIWIDVLCFGPFYVAAIYAFVKGRNWIRPWCFVWAGTMMANVAIILLEEHSGIYATHRFGIVLAANLPWFLLPVALIARMLPSERPFTVEAGARGNADAAPAGVPAGAAGTGAAAVPAGAAGPAGLAGTGGAALGSVPDG